jgi:hypothetical protein
LLVGQDRRIYRKLLLCSAVDTQKAVPGFLKSVEKTKVSGIGEVIPGLFRFSHVSRAENLLTRKYIRGSDLSFRSSGKVEAGKVLARVGQLTGGLYCQP